MFWSLVPYDWAWTRLVGRWQGLGGGGQTAPGWHVKQCVSCQGGGYNNRTFFPIIILNDHFISDVCKLTSLQFPVPLGFLFDSRQPVGVFDHSLWYQLSELDKGSGRAPPSRTCLTSCFLHGSRRLLNSLWMQMYASLYQKWFKIDNCW